MKVYKDSSFKTPALCPFRGMAQCVSECALYIEDFPDKGDCAFKGREPVWLYVGNDELRIDESRAMDGRE